LYAQNTDFGKGEPSVAGMNGRSRVGIFPNGDAAWNIAGIVWSGEANPHDTWQQVCVTATAGPQGKVTVFTSNDYRGSGAIHLDAWWDDAELVVLGVAPTAQPTAGAVQPTTVAQPQPTALPPVTNPDGSIVHTIVSGDTLFGLAFQYNVPVDTLLALNGLTKDSLLSIGQKIIIKGGTGAAPAQPTVAPQPTVPVSPTAATGQPAQPTLQPTAASGQPAANAAKLCVHAYNDANSDGLLTAGEEPVAGVQFAVANSQGVQVASYTSDASGEEHCFTDLPPGSYTVAVQPATGTVATSDKRWSVALTSGPAVNINFGSHSDASAPAAGGQPTTAPSSGGAGLSGLLGGAIGLILLLVAGVLGAFIIARRRA
jgi:LysM repeat protein